MKRMIVTWAAVATIGSAAAQSGAMGGLLLDRDLLMPADMVSFSQTQFNFGSARAMAMAGAFTSLGADVSSMSINPAGLGMYRKSEISLTPMMTFGQSTTDASPYGKNSTSRFSMSDVGIAIKAYEGTRGLVGLTIGVGYNRIADFNYDYSFQRHGQAGSVADVFARQMVWSGRSKREFYDNDGSGDWNWDRIPVDLWNAALAYRAFMIDQLDPENPDSWQATWIGDDAAVGHYTTVKSRGSAGEFALSVGANIENKLYIGATLGIQSIHQRLYIDYAEDYLYADPSQAHPYGTDPSLDYQLLYAKLNQATTVSGAGVNFKLGIVYRPVAGLRIGVAFHTPTYYSLDRKFQSSAAGMAYANNPVDPNVTPDDRGYVSSGTRDMTTPLWIDENPYNWAFCTPARLLLGASYTFGARAILSVDYERDWYNGIRLKNDPSGLDTGSFYNDRFRRNFKGSNTVRAGAEFKFTPALALRAGFGYSGSMLGKGAELTSPAIERTIYCSAGLGLALSRVVTLDLAYQYMNCATTDYYLFFSSDTVEMPDGSWGKKGSESSLYRTEFARHNVALTLGFRF